MLDRRDCLPSLKGTRVCEKTAPYFPSHGTPIMKILLNCLISSLVSNKHFVFFFFVPSVSAVILPLSFLSFLAEKAAKGELRGECPLFFFFFGLQVSAAVIAIMQSVEH